MAEPTTESDAQPNGAALPENRYATATRVDELENLKGQLLRERALRLETQRDLLVTQLKQVQREIEDNQAEVTVYQRDLRSKYQLGPSDAVNLPEGTIVRVKAEPVRTVEAKDT